MSEMSGFVSSFLATVEQGMSAAGVAAERVKRIAVQVQALRLPSDLQVIQSDVAASSVIGMLISLFPMITVFWPVEPYPFLRSGSALQKFPRSLACEYCCESTSIVSLPAKPAWFKGPASLGAYA